MAGSIEVCRRQASLISPEPSPSFKPVGIGLNSSTSGVLASRLSLVFLTSVQVLSHNWMMFFVTYAWSGWRSRMNTFLTLNFSKRRSRLQVLPKKQILVSGD